MTKVTNLELSHLAVEGESGSLGVPGTAEVSLQSQLDVEWLEQHSLTQHLVAFFHVHQHSGGRGWEGATNEQNWSI